GTHRQDAPARPAISGGPRRLANPERTARAPAPGHRTAAQIPRSSQERSPPPGRREDRPLLSRHATSDVQSLPGVPSDRRTLHHQGPGDGDRVNIDKELSITLHEGFHWVSSFTLSPPPRA